MRGEGGDVGVADGDGVDGLAVWGKTIYFGETEEASRLTGLL
jgi:hypothetical protein